MTHYLLHIYVAGQGVRAETAIRQLVDLCEEHVGDEYRLEVIDVIDDPERAERDGILVTPTVIRSMPPPRRRLVGDLTDSAAVGHHLGLAGASPRPA
ncbi:MAG: circadian clock KaiB family protein [Actinomycetota bacterium]|nr:circadian clock KaiB family protein [Actinomycetota bacterium]